MYFVFKVCQYGTNDFYIKNFKNFLINSRGNCGVVSRGGNVGFVGGGGWGTVVIMQKLVTLQFCDFLSSNW